MKTTLRELIKVKRQERGLSLEELAQATKSRAVDIRGYEEGLFEINLDQLCQLIRALSIDLSDLETAVSADEAKRLHKECK